jgi:electron transfer flavoprotein beta subunit
MKILVCLKQVPDHDSAFRINAEKTWVEEENLTYQINDYDRYALEESLRIKDANGSEVVVISVGPERVTKALRTSLAMGADRAIHVNDPGVEGSDALGIARILHAAAAGESFDLVLAGLQSEDDNRAQVGPMLARFLGVPCATGIVGLDLAENGQSIRVQRELEENHLQVVDLPLPALVTVQTGINEPRYASLKGIMAAKKKEIRNVKIFDLSLAADRVGRAGARTKVMEFAPPPKGKGGEILEGTTEEIVTELVQRIRKKTGVL